MFFGLVKLIGILENFMVTNTQPIADQHIFYKTAKLGDYMTKELLIVPYDKLVYKIKDIFLGKRVRRMLVTRHNQFIGLFTVGDVIRACLQEREKEVKKLSELVNLEYYDEWRWKKKKK